ncbi:MAG: lipoyl synthase [Desulfobacteraceae bacterium]|jgi:lipoyl synthase
MKIRPKKPPWLKRKLPIGPEYEQTRRRISKGKLHTVCQEANCPNIFECFSQHTATFLILGGRCTRHCTFCAVEKGPVALPDPDEPRRVAEAAANLELAYVVVTSVTRDDLEDGGAGQFSRTIRALRQRIDGVRIEVLIPDFQGDSAALETVLDAGPDILNHNIETVRRLYPEVRPQADYQQSLRLLQHASVYSPHIPAKSGLMLGLGETDSEIGQTLCDLREHGCRLLTIGQYLQPSAKHHPVVEYVTPEAFEAWREKAFDIGFDEVSAAPFVRSSYHAKQSYQNLTR